MAHDDQRPVGQFVDALLNLAHRDQGDPGYVGLDVRAGFAYVDDGRGAGLPGVPGLGGAELVHADDSIDAGAQRARCNDQKSIGWIRSCSSAAMRRSTSSLILA